MWAVFFKISSLLSFQGQFFSDSVVFTSNINSRDGKSVRDTSSQLSSSQTRTHKHTSVTNTVFFSFGPVNTPNILLIDSLNRFFRTAIWSWRTLKPICRFLLLTKFLSRLLQSKKNNDNKIQLRSKARQFEYTIVQIEKIYCLFLDSHTNFVFSHKNCHLSHVTDNC